MKKILVLLMLLCLQVEVFAVVLPEGTPVIIKPKREIDADSVRVGQDVKLAVAVPVKVNKQTLIKPDTEVTGQVIAKKNNFILGIPGELEISNFKIVQSNGNIIYLRGNILDKGEGKYWAHIGWFFLFPVLFVKGNDGKIPAGVEHILYTSDEIDL